MPCSSQGSLQAESSHRWAAPASSTPLSVRASPLASTRYNVVLSALVAPSGPDAQRGSAKLSLNSPYSFTSICSLARVTATCLDFFLTTTGAAFGTLALKNILKGGIELIAMNSSTLYSSKFHAPLSLYATTKVYRWGFKTAASHSVRVAAPK